MPEIFLASAGIIKKLVEGSSNGPAGSKLGEEANFFLPRDQLPSKAVDRAGFVDRCCRSVPLKFSCGFRSLEGLKG